MQSNQNNSPESDMDLDQWRTAGVFERTFAKRYLRRLDAAEIDHLASSEGAKVRISVRRCDLEAAISIVPETNRTRANSKATAEANLVSHRLLYTIPVGAFCGSIVAYVTGFDSPMIPLAICMLVVLVIEVVMLNLTGTKSSRRGGRRVRRSRPPWRPRGPI